MTDNVAGDYGPAAVIACAYEDRPSHLLGVKLLVCSLARHAPDLQLQLTCPVADENLRRWLEAYPQVTLDVNRPSEARGWDVKPTLLLRLLDQGHDEVVWLDSDIILTRDFRPFGLSPEVLLLAEDDYWNGPKECALRTLGWGLPLGRKLPRVPNSGVIRVTPAHRSLLVAWQGLMATPEYRRAQQAGFGQRPFYMLGDQDVIASLLGSEEFASVPVEFLLRGRDIIQHCSPPAYAPTDRIANLFRGTPAFVHIQAEKPWTFTEVPRFWQDPRRYYSFLAVECSPYGHFARKHAAELGELPACLQIRSWPGRLSDVASLGNPHLRGFSQALFSAAYEYVEWAVRFSGRATRKARALLSSGHADRTEQGSQVSLTRP